LSWKRWICEMKYIVKPVEGCEAYTLARDLVRAGVKLVGVWHREGEICIETNDIPKIVSMERVSSVDPVIRR
jgi:hypothetical protein